MEEPLSSSEPSVDDRGIKPPPAFRVEELPAPPGTLLLKLIGELDLAASGGFRERVEAALAAGVRHVVIDMEETRFIDSSMLKELLRGSTAASDAGGALVLTGTQPAVNRLFELTRVSEILTFAPSREAALEQVSGGAAGG